MAAVQRARRAVTVIVALRSAHAKIEPRPRVWWNGRPRITDVGGKGPALRFTSLQMDARLLFFTFEEEFEICVQRRDRSLQRIERDQHGYERGLCPTPTARRCEIRDRSFHPV